MIKGTGISSQWMLWLMLGTLLILAFLLDLALGSVRIPASEVLAALGLGELQESKYGVMILDSRLPRALTALFAGAALAIAGLLMQTFFRNPVAGPYILGVSSGATLGIALVVLVGIGGGWTLAREAAPIRVLAAGLGAMLSLLLVLLASSRIRDIATLLILGLMFGSFTSAITGVLQYFADKDSLRDFVYWTFGSLDQTHWEELRVLMFIVGGGILLSWMLSRPLNGLLLGEDYASSIGVSVSMMRYAVIGVAGILAGVVTAYCGPVAFVGLAVPHLIRGLFSSTDHRVLIPACAMGGAILLLSCDVISRVPGWSVVLPVNAVTSMIGAPVVIGVLVRARRFGGYFG